MSKARVIAEALRSLGDLGTTNYAKDKKLCYDAADLIEEDFCTVRIDATLGELVKAVL